VDFPATNASANATGTCNSGYSVFVGDIPSATTFPRAECSPNGDGKSANWSTVWIQCQPNCLVQPCENSGDCVPGGTNGPQCICQGVYTGKYCEIGPPTPTPTPTPTPSPSLGTQASDGNSSAGAIAGGIIGGLIGLLILVLILLFLLKGRFWERKGKNNAASVSSRESLGGAKAIELDANVKNQFNSGAKFGDGNSSAIPETTLMNTALEVAVPGFLLLEIKKHFEQGEQIGVGGFSNIYKGELTDSGLKLKYNITEIAVKMVQNSPSLTAEQNNSKFNQEISILWSLNNYVNVVSLIGYCNHPQAIITKLYQTDLFQFVHTPTINISAGLAVNIARDIASGMAGIHANNIAHR